MSDCLGGKHLQVSTQENVRGAEVERFLVLQMLYIFFCFAEVVGSSCVKRDFLCNQEKNTHNDNTLPLTNSSPLKIGTWETILSFLGWRIFRGVLLVSGRVNQRNFWKIVMFFFLKVETSVWGLCGTTFIMILRSISVDLRAILKGQFYGAQNDPKVSRKRLVKNFIPFGPICAYIHIYI